MDWTGLLKWSIANSDGTVKKDIQPMDEERRKWLTEALTENAMTEVRQIEKILIELQKEDLQTPEDEQNKINLLESMEDIIDNLDMADTLYQMGGLVVLIRQAMNSKYSRVQQICLSLFITCNQNNSHVQQWSIAEGGFQFINLILKSEDIKTREWALAAISSLVRGENLQAKRDFIDVEGVQFLLQLLEDPKQSIKMKTKCFSILKDLVFYDWKLNKTYSNLDSFSNTNAKVVNGKETLLVKTNNSEKNNDISYDQNKELSAENDLKENQKYKDCVKELLQREKFLDKYFSVLENLDNDKYDIRLAFLDITKLILETSSESKAQFKESKMASMKQMMLATMKHNTSNQNINEEEIELYKQILVILSKP